MVVALTTLDRVKRHRQIPGDGNDEFLTDLIESVSKDFETFTQRHVHATARTEVYEIDARQHRLSLRGAPVSSLTSVKYTNNPAYFDDADELTTDQFYLDYTKGLLHLYSATFYQPGYVQVVYAGGMATGASESAATSTFIAGYPDISKSVDIQVAAHLVRRGNPQGDISFTGGGMNFTDEVGLLRDVRRTWSKYRRVQL